MRPIRLTMQAFGSYGRRTEIDFTKPVQNIFLITGDTGAGKTTIFDAIVFALYGEASSGINKKDGAELQSQYIDYKTEPFVELIFTEEQGGGRQEYTVHRVPRHVRPKRGGGTIEVKETVSLTLPDGMGGSREFSENQKQTDARIEEIIGLTKSQFMQVAMIAQGEFMELLRADSNRKKEIFRKLFGTERFQRIVDELSVRHKEKNAEIGRIRTQCQTEIAHIVIPEGIEDREDLQELKACRERILKTERLSVVDMEELMERLQQLIQELKEDEKTAAAAEKDASERRDGKRDANEKGKLLKENFRQFREAERILQECREKEPLMQEQAALVQRLQTAGRLRAEYKALEDAKAQLLQKELQKTSLETELPQLLEHRKKALAQEQEAQSRKERLAQWLPKAVQGAEIEQQVQRLQKDTANRQKEYLTSREEAVNLRDKWQKAQNAFLDQQAGFLAQQLEEGKPCPVCGALEHPSPCSMKPQQSDLTRAAIDRMAQDAAAAESRQSKKAAGAEAARQMLEDRQAALESARQELLAEFQAEFQTEFRTQFQKEGQLSALAQSLSGESGRQEQVYQKAHKEAETIKTKCNQKEALAEQLSREIPQQQDLSRRRREEYEESLQKVGTTTEQWQQILQQYPADAAQELQHEIEVYRKRRDQAAGSKETAGRLIQGQTEPDLAQLQEEYLQADAAYQAARQQMEQAKSACKDNETVYQNLAPKMQERAQKVRENQQIENLYNRLAGKNTGARMDIETYVQRYYLQRILYGANLRFEEMSGGQFELRMVPEEQAGAGKNRGLDLLVYSAVTGKEREVRTLSGGESFMAALALALGMADQIQESSATIHLDMMFIDEGFGSLDDRARGQAVRVLQEMAGGDKLIGIISHVTELQQELENQLIVTKDNEGSHVRWVLS